MATIPHIPTGAGFATPFVVPIARGTSQSAPLERRIGLEMILTECSRSGASDVHLTSGQPVYFRVNDHVVQSKNLLLSADDVDAITHALLSDAQFAVYDQQRQLDLAFSAHDGTRYRVNLYRQRGQTALAIRRLDNAFSDLNQLHLPPHLIELGNFPYGLVIVTGPTGSGKSTTLASILHHINCTRPCHIITIEDPIEHLHANRQALVHQRELHVDVVDFASALKAALREDPDVLLVGEMRDLETMRAALTAAETGHLVLSTLHTGDAPGAVGRMVGSFPADEQPMVRDQLSRVLRAVVSQRLIRKKDGQGRVPAVEIMRVNSALSNLIRTGDMRQALSIIQSGADDGMLLLEQSLALLTAADFISREEALRWCRDVNIFESRMKQVAGKARGW